jgi:hypothetical protein
MIQASRIANCGLQTITLLLLVWSTRRASQSAAPSGFGPGARSPAELGGESQSANGDL